MDKRYISSGLDISLEEDMARASAGDAKAYDRVLRASAQLVRPYVMRHLQSRAEGEDVLQEILLSLHRARHTYDGKRPFKPWLFAIARFRLKDHLRRHYADRLRIAATLNEADHATQAQSADITYDNVAGEIRQLSGNQPQILELIHRDGYTTREVAKRLGMNESAVRVAAHRAYKILRKKLAV